MKSPLLDLFHAQEPKLIQATISIAERVQKTPSDPAYPNTPPRTLVVGGFVRDLLIGGHPKDIDLEVYGVEPKRLAELLHELFPGQVNPVGQSFGILKIRIANDMDCDVSIPRRESKTGKGHRGFTVESDPGMTTEDAARRRDFTINAISLDPLTGEVIDPFHGQKDLADKLLRVTDPERFQDDPLRVYRAIQLTARMDLIVEPNTLSLLQSIVARGDLNELAAERIADEWKKLLLKADRPSIGFDVARKLGIIQAHIPELHALIGTEQEPEWHPEGDVWIHTMMVIDQAAQIIRQPERAFSETEQLQVMYGALCHDLGKPSTTKMLDGRIRSRGHEEAGAEPTKRLIERFAVSHDIEQAAIAIAKEHLKPPLLYREKAMDKLNDEQYANAVRRLVKRIHPVSWRVLLAVAEADTRGRGAPGMENLSAVFATDFIEAVRAQQLDADPTNTLLQGRDLLELGVPAGPLVGKIIDEIERLRDEGTIKTKAQALDEAREIIERP